MLDIKNDSCAQDVYTEDDVLDVTKEGIILRGDGLISFSGCSRIFDQMNHVNESLCVGERNITELRFVFYTSARPKAVVFLKKNFWKEIFGSSVNQRFHDFQRRIEAFGYKTYDMS